MLRTGDVIVVCALCLLCLGVVMVQSAQMTVGGADAGSLSLASILGSRTALYALLSVVAMLLASRAPMERLFGGSASPILWLGPLLIGLSMLVYIPGLGREINGARRWIAIPTPMGGDLTIQPSELVKWGLIVALAWHAGRRSGSLRRFRDGLALPLVLIAALAGIVALEDFGTAALIGASGVIVLIAAGASIRRLAALTPIALLAAAAAVLMRPYRVQRLLSFLDPFADPGGAGYHMIQSMLAVGSGGIFGRGLGFGLQKFGYLPEDRTDFVFAVIAEELGLAGAAVVLSLYMALLWSGWSIARRQRDPAMRLLGLGVVATLGLQAVMNLAVVTGLGPTKGIALPLLSAGGTGWLLTAASLGLLVGMDRRSVKAANDSLAAVGDAGARAMAHDGAA